MEFEIDKTDGATLYKLLTGLVIPRPIGWVSTIDQEGKNNLAPFSFFNVIGEDPPHVMFSTVRTGNKNKDTLNNVLANGEFVVNLVTRDVVEAMNETAAPLAPEIDEFAYANLTPIPSKFVKPMRVKESSAHFECKMVHHYFLENHKNGGACIVIGKVLNIHVKDELVDERIRINLDLYKPVARLAGSNYGEIGEIFTVKRPTQ